MIGPLLLATAWSDSLPCQVDTFWVHKVSGEKVWQGYVTGDILWLSSSMGTALYRPERGPEPRTILAGWWTPTVGGMVERDVFPPVVFRFSAIRQPALHVARVDPPSGLVEEEVVIPGIPILQSLRVSPLLDNRFFLVHRTAPPGEPFRTRLFLFSLHPLALLDTLTVGMASPYWNSLASTMAWPEEAFWSLVPIVPLNRGISARGSRDDLGAVVLLSTSGRVLRTRNLPWPLFALPTFSCHRQKPVCILNAQPTNHTPPGVSGRAWWLRFPDLQVLREEVLPPRTLVIPFQEGELWLNWDRPEGRWRSPEGREDVFSLPRWLVDVLLRFQGTTRDGLWFQFREPIGTSRDPRDIGKLPKLWGLFFLSPRGMFHLQIRGSGATGITIPDDRGIWWPILETLDRVGILRIRCPRP